MDFDIVYMSAKDCVSTFSIKKKKIVPNHITRLLTILYAEIRGFQMFAARSSCKAERERVLRANRLDRC